MPDLTIILLAAGRSTRFGGAKQLEPVGPEGETILELTLRDAFKHGCTRAIIVARPAHEDLFLRMAGTDTRIGIVLQPEALGTAHAAMLALERTTSTVIIANADDLYGEGSMAMACAHALSGPWEDHALVAFELRNTLSGHGGVNRALCHTDDNGSLRSTREVLGLHLDADRRIVDAEGRTWPDVSPVSMNLWVMRPSITPFFVEGFAGRDQAREFGLPDVVQAAIDAGVRFHLLTSSDRWLGLTYGGDAQLVRRSLHERDAT